MTVSAADWHSPSAAFWHYVVDRNCAVDWPESHALERWARCPCNLHTWARSAKTTERIMQLDFRRPYLIASEWRAENAEPQAYETS